jgi:hypothetical protein
LATVAGKVTLKNNSIFGIQVAPRVHCLIYGTLADIAERAAWMSQKMLAKRIVPSPPDVLLLWHCHPLATESQVTWIDHAVGKYMHESLAEVAKPYYSNEQIERIFNSSYERRALSIEQLFWHDDLNAWLRMRAYLLAKHRYELLQHEDFGLERFKYSVDFYLRSLRDWHDPWASLLGNSIANPIVVE